jgi:hypothetical protein
MRLEDAAAQVRKATNLDPAELGMAVAAAADVLHELLEASNRLQVETADVPDLPAMHAWSLRLVKRGGPRRRGILWLLR